MPAQLGKPANNDGSEEDLKAPATKNLQASPASSDVEQPQGHDHDREAYDHRHQHGTICLHGHGPVGGVKEFGTAKQKVSAHVWKENGNFFTREWGLQITRETQALRQN